MHDNDTQESVLKVTDRRHFTDAGERRPDVEPDHFEEAAPPPPPAPTASAPRVKPTAPSTDPKAGRPAPGVPPADSTAPPHHERLAAREITFLSLVQDLYATCLMQLGAEIQPGQRAQLDLEGARETIDLLGLLQEKTHGNLQPAEDSMLDRALYELRLAYVDVQRAATSRVQPAHVVPPPPPRR